MTANNQYFERNMLINAEKTNITLESDNWGPKTELANINRFLDASAAIIDHQIIINDTLTSILENNDGSLESIQQLNAKLDYQNARPVGIGSDDVWLPTELLMDIKTALALQTEIQKETGLAGMIDILKDISRNTGFTIPDKLDDISKNTYFIHDHLYDNSVNLVQIIDDLSGNNTDTSKNLITINTTLNDKLGATGQISIDLGNINLTLSGIDTGNLTAINNGVLQVIANTSAINANVAGAGAYLANIDTNTAKLPESMKTKKSYSSGLTPTENWVQDLVNGDDFVEGRWWTNEPGNIFPPKKFALFLEIDEDLLATEFINFYSQGDPVMGWLLRDRFVLQDFNPIVGIAHPGAPNTYLSLSRTYDWMGEYMKIDIATGAPLKKIVKCYAQGI